MSVGDLVTYVDWDSTGGFGSPKEHIGIIIDIPPSKCLPPLVEIMLPDQKIITIHSDEIRHVKH